MADVAELLGEPSGKIAVTHEFAGITEVVPEFWEYGNTPSWGSTQPQPSSYVVFFSPENTVDSFRTPKTGDSEKYRYEDLSDRLRVGSDSLESIFLRKDGPINEALEPPALLQPPDGAVFRHYPREIQFVWKPGLEARGGAGYYLQVDFTDPDDEAEFGLWDGAEATFTERTAKTTYNYRHPGSQPGRWRVKTYDRDGESKWTGWRYFRFDCDCPNLDEAEGA